jgi:hypothetical protein
LLRRFTQGPSCWFWECVETSDCQIGGIRYHDEGMIIVLIRGTLDDPRSPTVDCTSDRQHYPTPALVLPHGDFQSYDPDSQSLAKSVTTAWYCGVLCEFKERRINWMPSFLRALQMRRQDVTEIRSLVEPKDQAHVSMHPSSFRFWPFSA